MQVSQLVTHPLPPIFDKQSRVLLLGTMPSPLSRELGFHYANPRNRFWPVIAALWQEEKPSTDAERRDFCRRHRLAIDDVLASCHISGAADSTITDAVPNDLHRICDCASIQKVFCTGATATHLYRKLIEPSLGLPCVQLPSTSPANARMRLADLIVAWEPVRIAADEAGEL